MRKKVNKKLIVALLSFVLLFGGTFGSSLAWLLDTSDDVQNTFSTSNINITLTETDTTEDADGNATKNFKMIPGHVVDKDPKITVASGSEDCWVFIEVEESRNLPDYISYSIDSNKWTKLESADPRNIYYAVGEEGKVTAGTTIEILGAGEENDFSWNANQVLTKPTVTKEMMEASVNLPPLLTFKAYATQYWKSNNVPFTVEEAWALAKDLD